MKKRKMVAVLAAVMLVAFLICSYTYLIENVHHHCTGENCPICLEIEAAIQTISNFKILPILPLIIVVLCVRSHICNGENESYLTKDTLISLKVELLI